MKVLDVKRAIQESGMTASEVAERMGVSRQSVQQMIGGNPTAKSISALAAALNVDPGALFYDNASDVPSAPSAPSAPVAFTRDELEEYLKGIQSGIDSAIACIQKGERE